MTELLLPLGVGALLAGVALQVYQGERIARGPYDPSSVTANAYHWRNFVMAPYVEETQHDPMELGNDYLIVDGKRRVLDNGQPHGQHFHPGFTRNQSGDIVNETIVNKMIIQTNTGRPLERPKGRKRRGG